MTTKYDLAVVHPKVIHLFEIYSIYYYYYYVLSTHLEKNDHIRVYHCLWMFSTCVFPGLALRELLGAAYDLDCGQQPKPLAMIGKTHGQRQPSKASAHHALEVCASLVVSRSTIDAIRDGLAGKWNTPMTSIIVSKWIEKTLPRLRVWIPVAVHSFVLPMQLLSEVENEPGYQVCSEPCAGL